jgi:DNA-binding transcriptional ArsR family regulator
MPGPEVDAASWRPEGADPDLFRAVADPHRRVLMEALVAGPATVSELARRIGRPRQTTAYHAGVLVEVGAAELRGHWLAARPEALRILSRYFDLALLGAARGEAQIAVQKSGRGATKSSKKQPR